MGIGVLNDSAYPRFETNPPAWSADRDKPVGEQPPSIQVTGTENFIWFETHSLTDRVG